jgi:hypothetical protein
VFWITFDLNQLAILNIRQHPAAAMAARPS